MKYFFFTIGFVSLSCTAALAACEKGADPCAPKKELGSWDKSLAFGLNYTSGNSDTTVLNFLGKLSRETSDDMLDFNAAYGYGEDRGKADTEDKTNRNDFRAGVNYKYLLSDRVYTGTDSTFLYDEIADVDYRLMLSGIAGYYLLKDDTFKLGVDAGPGVVFEKVGDESKEYFAPRIGDRFDWTISCTSKVYQSAVVLFDTTDSNNVLVTAEIGVEAAISSKMGLVFLVRDTFDNVPAESKERNDVAIITALKVAL